MVKHRSGRFAVELQREIAAIIKKEVSDPRLEFVSVTRVEASPDLSHAKVFISSMKAGNEVQEEVLAALKSAGGFIRHKLSKVLGTRIVPELHFIADDSIAYGVYMTDFINKQIRDDEAAAAQAQPVEAAVAGRDDPGTPPSDAEDAL